MVCFAGLCIVAIGFVYRFLPETKGLSVEQAVQVYEKDAEGGRLGRLSGTPPALQPAHPNQA
jgi:MFS transporter, SP family, arabinose:H+ symporter